MTRPYGSTHNWVYRFLALRDGETCFLCGNKEDSKGNRILIVEHLDNNPKNYDPNNMHLAHIGCNLSKNNRSVAPNDTTKRERERTTRTTTQIQEPHWSSKEGAKHDRMRTKWNHWVQENHWYSVRKSALPLSAVHALGEGSSVTYARYLEEDISGGIFQIWEENGITMLGFVKEKETPMVLEQKDREQGTKEV